MAAASGQATHEQARGQEPTKQTLYGARVASAFSPDTHPPTFARPSFPPLLGCPKIQLLVGFSAQGLWGLGIYGVWVLGFYGLGLQVSAFRLQAVGF